MDKVGGGQAMVICVDGFKGSFGLVDTYSVVFGLFLPKTEKVKNILIGNVIIIIFFYMWIRVGGHPAIWIIINILKYYNKIS